MDLFSTGCFSAVLRGRDRDEHVLLTDGLRQIRLDVRGGSLLDRSARLRFAFDGLVDVEAPLLTFRRLVAFHRLRRMPRGLFASASRADRQIAALRASDAERAGASQREVAEAIFGADRVRCDWAGRSDYLRSSVRRLLRAGHRMTRGGWRDLLKAPVRL